MNLVTILIPTYNRPQYLKIALESILNQTYQNFEIIISDNSPNDETESMLQSFNDSRIKYFHDPNGNADSNWDFLRHYDNMNSEWVHWLMDDDAWKPNHLEVMLKTYEENPNVSLLMSGSEEVDGDGNHVKFLKHFGDKIVKKSGTETGRDLLITSYNFIGMPSHILMNKKFLRFGDNACWSDEDRGFFSLIDVSTWLQLLSKGDFMYIPDILTVQREHPKKASHDFKILQEFSIDFYIFVQRAWDQKIFLTTREEVIQALKGVYDHHAIYNFRRKMNDERTEFLRKIIQLADNFINGAEELPKFEF